MSFAQEVSDTTAALAHLDDFALIRELLIRVGKRVDALPDELAKDAMLELAIDLSADMGVTGDDVAVDEPDRTKEIVVSAAELFYGYSALAGFDIVHH